MELLRRGRGEFQLPPGGAAAARQPRLEAALGVTLLPPDGPGWRLRFSGPPRNLGQTAQVPGSATRPTPVSITSVNGATGSITSVTGIITIWNHHITSME